MTDKQLIVDIKNDKLSADSVTFIGNWSIAQLSQTVDFLAKYISSLSVNLPQKPKIPSKKVY